MKRKRAQSTFTNIAYTANITSESHDGRGIAIGHDGKTTFINGALIGETVQYRLSKLHRKYNEADVVEIITASPQRTSPECKHFGVCGGCSLQHMNQLAQIQLKQQTLLDQLKHFGHIEPESLLTPISAGEYNYRRKARLGVRYVEKKGKMFVGFREKASRYLADIDTCAILHPSVGQRLPEIKALMLSLEQFEQIPQIEIAVGDDATALIIRHMNDLPESDINKCREFAKTHQIHLYLQANPPVPLQKIWPEDQNHRLTYALTDYQINIHFHPLDFTQVNAELNPLMVKQACELLDPQSTETVLDLFCGLGNFTLPLAKSAKHVTGVEGSLDMVERAKENAEINHLSNTSFFAENLAAIPKTKPDWMQQTYDKILLDPPRTGAKDIIHHFSTFDAKRIVYVSCNPATLARDAGLLAKIGYKLKKVGIINMFPQTSHIEAMAVFEKK